MKSSRQIAGGGFASADEAVRAGVQILEERAAEIAELRRLIDDGDADIAAGRIYRDAKAEDLIGDIASDGGGASRKR